MSLKGVLSLRLIALGLGMLLMPSGVTPGFAQAVPAVPRPVVPGASEIGSTHRT